VRAAISVKRTPVSIALYRLSTAKLCVKIGACHRQCDRFAHVHFRAEQAPGRMHQSQRDSRSSRAGTTLALSRSKLVTEESYKTKSSFDSSRDLCRLQSESAPPWPKPRAPNNRTGDDTARHLSAGNFERRDTIPAHPVGNASAEGQPIQ
jgi:hypothetical protein